jgi:dihydropteroate synthase
VDAVPRRSGDGAEGADDVVLHVVLSGIPDPQRLAGALPGGTRLTHGRLEVVATRSTLLAAAAAVSAPSAGSPEGAVGGERGAAAGSDDGLAAALDAAVAAWHGGPEDVHTPAGVLRTSRGPVVMGVLNVTPDSFSDGGRAYTGEDHPGRAVRAGEALIAAGAEVVDVGGESTRPGSRPVDVDDELARVVPVVAALAGKVVVSVDTTKAAVARAAVAAGAGIVNDVSAGRFDAQMWPTVAELGVPYVLMHMQGEPRTMQRDPRYDDVVAEVFDTLAEGLAGLRAAGVPEHRVLVDPGIGFGKTVAHNLALLDGVRELTSLGRPVVIGASRKSFIGAVTEAEDTDDRLAGSLAVAAASAVAGASVIRAHDVADTVAAVRTAAAIAAARRGDRGRR